MKRFSFDLSNAAARSDISPARWRLPFLRLLDGIEPGWAVPFLLIGFVAIWMAFLVVAYLVGDLHSDVLETWTLGRTLEWGSIKHPPLMGWVARAWMSIFPLTNWSFQLLALINSAVALWAIDLISRRFVKGDKRALILLLLMLPPVFQLLAQRFNANAVLLAAWPIATYCFLRSFETRQLKLALAAGANAALAMLGKYYSVFLIGSFVFAAICHPQRRAYFGSSAPWISAVVGGVALGPHMHWLATTGATPFAYALVEHGGKEFARALRDALGFLLGVSLGLALPALIWATIAGPRLRMLAHDFREMDSRLFLLFLIAIGTVLFPPVTAVALGTDLPPIWAAQGLFLFVVLMVCGASYPVERFYTVNLMVIVAGIALIAVVVAAPLHAYYRNTYPLNEGRNFYRQAAIELTRQWHEQSEAPLPMVGGEEGLALATAFYSPDHPRYEGELVCPKKDPLPSTTISRGWAGLCFVEDEACIDRMKVKVSRSPRWVEAEFTAQSTLFGEPGAERRIRAFVIPPANEKMITSLSPADLFTSHCRGIRHR